MGKLGVGGPAPMDEPRAPQCNGPIPLRASATDLAGKIKIPDTLTGLILITLKDVYQQNSIPRKHTSKGSYRSWRKIVKVWTMMKEGIFAGHPSLALPLPPPPPGWLLPHLPLPSTRSPSSPSTQPCGLKWQNAK